MGIQGICLWLKTGNYYIIIIVLDNAPYKMLHKLKRACSIRKNQLWTSTSSSVSHKSQDPTDRSINSTGNPFQQLPGTSSGKGSQTPIRPVARHNKIPTNGRSQSRPTRNCWTLSAKSNKVSWNETSKTFEH